MNVANVKVAVMVGDGKSQTFKSTEEAPLRAFELAAACIRAAAIEYKAERTKVQKAADAKEQQAASYKRAGRELVVTPDPARAKGKGS